MSGWYVSGDALVCGDALVSGNALVCGDARVYGNARVYGDARVSGNALVCGDAQVCGDALVCGDAQVYGDARVSGNAWVRKQTDIAWVDRVGTGNPMTLHRIETDGVEGWRINAGCIHFEAATVKDVCAAVKANIAAEPDEWSNATTDERELWAKQVCAALEFLAASVVEDVQA